MSLHPKGSLSGIETSREQVQREIVHRASYQDRQQQRQHTCGGPRGSRGRAHTAKSRNFLAWAASAVVVSSRVQPWVCAYCRHSKLPTDAAAAQIVASQGLPFSWAKRKTVLVRRRKSRLTAGQTRLYRNSTQCTCPLLAAKDRARQNCSTCRCARTGLISFSTAHSSNMVLLC